MMLFGLKVYSTKHAVEKFWRFPKDRFIELEPHDESWCRKLGIGHEEYRPSAFQVGNDLYLHPEVLEALKKELQEQPLPLVQPPAIMHCIF